MQNTEYVHSRKMIPQKYDFIDITHDMLFRTSGIGKPQFLENMKKSKCTQRRAKLYNRSTNFQIQYTQYIKVDLYRVLFQKVDF